MFYVSDLQGTSPAEYKTHLQQMIYETFEKLNIPFQRVDTDEAITMEDCVQIDAKLDMKMGKTLFLCNRKQSRFYLFITCGDKPFRACQSLSQRTALKIYLWEYTTYETGLL